MTLVEIDINNAPRCLLDLSANLDNTYENLQGDCKAQVQNELRIAQHNLCAYCQKSIEHVITIEHYIAQNDVDGNGLGLELAFSNFLGVCTGKYYLPVEEDKKPKKFTPHCGNNRENTPLTIDPRNQADIDTLSFDENARIVSSNTDIDNDLNNTLNLNFKELCEKRKTAFNDSFSNFLIAESGLSLAKEEVYRRALISINTIHPEYYGYLRFQFTRLISLI